MPVEGAVDGVLGRFVVGWARDPAQPARRVDVEVELDGDLIGSATANLERGDLLVAGVGDGCHAFRIEMPAALEPGSEHTIAVRVDADGLALPLANDFVVELDRGVTGPPVMVHAGPLVRSDPEHHGDAREHERDQPGSQDDGGPIAHEPPSVAAPTAALLGSEGWLFELHDLATLELILSGGAAERIAAARERLLQRSTRLRDLDVIYVAAVVPDKAALYPDRLPAELKVASGLRTVDAISAALCDVNGIELLDLLTALRAARRHGQLMTRTGTELTWLGAFHAYRAVAKELAKRFPAITPKPLSALALGVEIPITASLAARERFALVGGDLVALVVGDDPIETEPEMVGGELDAVFVPLRAELDQRLGPGASMLELAGADVDSGAMIVHGRGGARVAKLLAEHFSSTLISVSDEPPYEIVSARRPRLLVDLVDEACLAQD